MENLDELIKKHKRIASYCEEKENWMFQNHEEAFEAFRRDADMGSPLGMIWLGDCYYNGYGVEKNYALAVQCYEKGFAYRKGSGDCDIIEYKMHKLGSCYELGNGTDKDERAAFECFEISAEAGNVRAMYNLAEFYEKNDNQEKAFDYYELAASCGDKTAMIILGDYYTDYTTEHTEGYIYFEGYREKYSENKFVGFQNPIDSEKGFAWYQKANNRYRLACCYYEGVGTEKNWAKVVKLFQDCETDGYIANAMFHCYATGGNGLEKNKLKAAKWLAISLIYS